MEQLTQLEEVIRKKALLRLESDLRKTAKFIQEESPLRFSSLAGLPQLSWTYKTDDGRDVIHTKPPDHMFSFKSNGYSPSTSGFMDQVRELLLPFYMKTEAEQLMERAEAMGYNNEEEGGEE